MLVSCQQMYSYDIDFMADAVFPNKANAMFKTLNLESHDEWKGKMQ